MEVDYSIYYSKWHNDTDECYRNNSIWYQCLLRPVLNNTPETANILDVGCGTGLLVNMLKDAGFSNVRGIDTSLHQIATATRRGLPCEAVKDEYIFCLADSEPASHDLIFLMDVLEHIPVPEQMRFVDALFRILKNGGRLVVCVPNANSSFGMRWRYSDWTHHTAFTEDSLEFVALNRGFVRIEFLPFEYGMPLQFPYFHQLSFWTRVLRTFVRSYRRLEAIGELGRQGMKIPLSLNIMAVLYKGE